MEDDSWEDDDKENFNPGEEYWDRSWILEPLRPPFIQIGIFQPHPPLRMRSNDDINRDFNRNLAERRSLEQAQVQGPQDEEDAENLAEDEGEVEDPAEVAFDLQFIPVPPMFELFAAAQLPGMAADEQHAEARAWYYHVRTLNANVMREMLLRIDGVGPVTVDLICARFPNIGVLVDYLQSIEPAEVALLSIPMQNIRIFFCDYY